MYRYTYLKCIKKWTIEHVMRKIHRLFEGALKIISLHNSKGGKSLTFILFMLYCFKHIEIDIYLWDAMQDVYKKCDVHSIYPSYKRTHKLIP